MNSSPHEWHKMNSYQPNTSHFISSDLSLSILLDSLRFPCLRTYFGVLGRAAISQEMRDSMPSEQLFSGTPFNISCPPKNSGLNTRIVLFHFSPRGRRMIEIASRGYTRRAWEGYSFPTVLHLGIGERVAWPGLKLGGWATHHPKYIAENGLSQAKGRSASAMAPAANGTSCQWHQLPMAPAGLPCAWSLGSSAVKGNLSFHSFGVN